jgi:hypothetical protein
MWRMQSTVMYTCNRPTKTESTTAELVARFVPQADG